MATLLNLFEFLRPSEGRQASRRIDFTTVRGKALGNHLTDGEAAALASHNNYVGHVIRDVVSGVQAAAFDAYGQPLYKAELPYVMGHEGSVWKVDELEAEGADLLITSGTGALSAATAVGSECSYFEGKIRLTQSAEQVNLNVSANNLTPFIAGNVRLRFEKAN